MLNAVLREVQAWADTVEELNGKQINVVTFSYLYSTDAPVKMGADGKYEALDPTVVPAENMYIRLTPYLATWYYSLSDMRQVASFRDYIKQWSSICSKFMVWDYGADFSHFFHYLPTIQRIKTDLKAYKDAGVVYYMQQNAHTEYNAVLAVMDSYVFNKLLWNIELDPYELRREFISLYFGEGADETLDAIEFMDNYLYQASEETNGQSSWELSAVYHKAAYLEHVRDLLNKGIEDVKASSVSDELKDMYVKHLEQVKLYPLYLMLRNRQALYADNQAMFRTVTDEFFGICEKHNVSDWGENFSISSLKVLYP